MVRKILNTSEVREFHDLNHFGFGSGNFICPFQMIDKADFFLAR